jgi:5-methylcytosine-specific restriction endonuclease McrBC GTP-binding regulatory subunit McrB
MCQRKPKKQEKIRHKIDPKYRTGRTYNDFKQYIEAHPDIAVVQMDTVVGSDGGKVLLTINFDCGLMLACIRNTNNSQSVIDYFDNIEKQFGLKMFKKLFPVILTDNGSEFSNPTAIET